MHGIIQWALNICMVLAGLWLWVVAVVVFSVGYKLIKNIFIKDKEPIRDIVTNLNLIKVIKKVFAPLDDKNDNQKAFYRRVGIGLTLAIGVGLIYGAIIYSPFASSSIGSFIEKSEYTQYYYVYLYPEGSESKNYKVKAEIYAHYVEYPDSRERVYSIVKAWFTNNGYITFLSDQKTLIVGKKVPQQDSDDKWWDVELTTEIAD